MKSLRLLVLGGLLGLAGCLVPYCARSVNRLPPVDLNCDAREVHAFSVSIRRHTVRDEEIKEQWEVRPVPVADAGKVPSQSKVSYDFGLYALSPTSPSGPLVNTTHSLCLRLYRPGYETVDMDADAPLEKVVWKPAADVAAQETALDEIFGLKPVIPAKGELAVERAPEPGGKSKEHRAALLFGASEYARLASAMGEPKREDLTEIKARLAAKAGRLGALAASGVKHKSQ